MNPEYDNSSILSVLKYMRNTYGDECLSSSSRMRSVLLDLAPGLKNEARHFYILADNGYFSEFAAVDHEGEGKKRLVANRARNFLVSEFILEARADYCIGVMEAVYGWRTDASVDELIQKLEKYAQTTEKKSGVKLNVLENDLSGRTSEEDTHRKEREEATRLRIRKEQEEKFALSKKVRLSEFQSLLSEIKTQSDDGKRFQTEYDSNNPRRQRLYQLADDAVQIKTLDDFFGKYDENLAMFRDMRFKSRDQFYIRRVCESNTEYVNIRKELSKAKEKLGNSGNVRGIGLPILLFPCLMIPLYWAVVNARSTGADTVTQWMGMFIFCTCLLAAGTVFVPFCFSDGQKEEKDSGNSIVPALLALVLGSIPAMIAFFVIMNKLINKAKSYQDNLDLSSIVTSMPSWWKYVVIVLAVLISVFAAFIGGIKAAVVMLIICYIAWRYIPSGGASILPATMRQVMDPFLKYCLYACLVCFALRMVVVFRRIIKSSKYKSAAKKIQEYTSQENRIRGEIYTDIYEKYRPYMDESYLLGWSELISLRNEELVE